MKAPDQFSLFSALEATWPAYRAERVGPWTVREGRGGGQRVSSATAEGAWNRADIDRAEQSMRALDQTPLFMVRSGEDDLDETLAERGYHVRDPVNLYLAETVTLKGEIRTAALETWPPLRVQSELWREDGIGPARLAVMDRAASPKAALLGRLGHRPVAVAFVSISRKIAFLHALFTKPASRRRGVAHDLMRAAAVWATRNGAIWLAVAVTRANAGANALYCSLGMTIATRYHYRALAR